MSANSAALSTFCFICPLLLAGLAPLYWKAKNWPVLLCFFWLILTNLSNAINAILWSDNSDIKAVPWCEISIRIDLVSSFALQCSAVLLLRRLEAIAATRAVRTTHSSRRRQTILEVGVGIGLPILYIILALLSQGHRFDILEGIGCLIYIFISPVSIVFTTIPPLLTSCVGFVYSVLCLRWLIIRRQQFKAVLHASASGIDKSHYLRLFALTATQIVFTMPSAWIIAMNNLVNSQAKINVYVSWNWVHAGYWRVDQFPRELITATQEGQTWYNLIWLGRWSIPLSSLLCFAYLGTSKEAIQHYKNAISVLSRPFRRSRITEPRRMEQNTLEIIEKEDGLPMTPQSSKRFDSYIDDLEYSQESPTARFDHPSHFHNHVEVTVHKTVRRDDESF